MADFIALLPRIVYSITIPCFRNARISSPPSAHRWPVTFFSHGLAGNRNLYSHFCASLSSYGAVVIALDHRDGSSPLQHVRATSDSPAHTIPTIPISYAGTDDNYAARDKQLRIRCWELGLAFASMSMLEQGQLVKNLDENPSHHKSWFSAAHAPEGESSLSFFKEKLDLRPGTVSWVGHSFGAATMIQFCKSVYHGSSLPRTTSDQRSAPLFEVDTSSPLAAQVTTESAMVLLDPWMMPLASPYQAALASKRIPALTKPGNGRNVLALVSEGFWNWKGNLDAVIAELRATSRLSEADNDGIAYYARGSKHFSQSDFGVLFSWIIERAWKSDSGRSIIEGNVRLVVDMLRRAGVHLADEAAGEATDLLKNSNKKVNGTKGKQTPGGSESTQEQLSEPLGHALPDKVDGQVWIRVPTR